MDTNTLAAAGFGCVGAQGLAGNQHYAAMQSVTSEFACTCLCVCVCVCVCVYA